MDEAKIPDDVMATATKFAGGEFAYPEVVKAIAAAIMAEREQCAAFAYAKHDWPPRWIASSLRGENDGLRSWLESAAEDAYQRST